jgi:probable HAF family extracellular repeat protein
MIVGFFRDSAGVLNGFVYANDRFVTVDVPGSLFTLINGINDTGQIIGLSGQASSQTFRGFLHTKGVFTIIEVSQMRLV